MATAKQLDEITECPICTEVYTDPRVLPCIHTYCLKCIESWGKDKQPGDNLACPLCREEFTLPSNGVGDLPKNFFVANFLQMKELSSVESKASLCEACSGAEETGTQAEKKVATIYCVQCQIKFCQNCERVHKVIKSTRSHKLVIIEDKMNVEALYQSMPPTSCDQHEDENLKIYCFECKSPICVICYIELHNTHKCSDIYKVEGNFRKQMTSDVDNITAGVDICKELLKALEKEKKDFDEQTTKAGVEISEKAEELKRMIDLHKEKLMNELSSMKQKRMKEIGSLHEEIEKQLLSMESYKKYVDELRQKGTACDIARAASGLHDRADELLMFNVLERTLVDLGYAHITFTPSNFVVSDVSHTLGKINMDITKRALIHAIPSQGKGSVTAVTSLGDEVFVLRYDGQQVEVYDAETFTLSRHIPVPELGAASYGLVACPINSCLYACSFNSKRVYRIDLLSTTGSVKQLFLASRPRGLALSKEHSLVVACDKANKLLEYTTDGDLVREITVTSPWQAVQLSNGDYVVSHRTIPGVVSVLGADGQVLQRYEQSSSSTVGTMKYPTSLAVTKDDNILVADQLNVRILSINRSTGCLQKLVLSADGEIQQPWGLCLDEFRGRLYVGEFEGQHRVLVFEVINL